MGNGMGAQCQGVCCVSGGVGADEVINTKTLSPGNEDGRGYGTDHVLAKNSAARSYGRPASPRGEPPAFAEKAAGSAVTRDQSQEVGVQDRHELGAHPPDDGQEDHTVTYEGGATFVGQLVDDKRHGHGVWRSNGGHYEGQWKLDQQDGEGHQTWHDGRVYFGQYRKGKFEGRGRMEWHTAQGVMVYDGQYVCDAKHGVGKFTWPDGRVYDGEWVSGRRSGSGTYVTARGDVRRGVWADDRLEKWLDEDDNPNAIDY